MKNKDIDTHNNSNRSFIAFRTKALSWWNSMTLEEQFYKTISWLKSENRNTSERHPQSLTGKEVETIYELSQIQTKK